MFVECDFNEVGWVGGGFGVSLIEGDATERAAGSSAKPLEEAIALEDMAARVYLEDLFIWVKGFLGDGAFGVDGGDDITIADGGGGVVYVGLGEAALLGGLL